MPDKPKRPCRKTGCPALVDGGGYCPAHLATQRRTYDRTQRNKQAKRFYDSAAWQAVRTRHLTAHPVCEMCAKQLATIVHHVKPLEVAPELALVDTNLQSACSSCHSQHHARDNRQRGTW